MKRLKPYAIAATLTLATGTISYAEDSNQYLTKRAAEPVSEISSIASDYFDANWVLFTDFRATQPIAYDKETGIASNYFDANWTITQGSRPTSAKSSTEISSDYLDANWAVFER